MALFTLIGKDLKIVFIRRFVSTVFRAWLLPLAFIIFLSQVKNFFLPPSVYGIGEIRPIRHLTTDVFNSSTDLGGRNKIVFVDNGFKGGEIDKLINHLSGPLQSAGADVQVLSSDDELLQVCQSSLAGYSPCFASASFSASPSEGPGGVWSYLARVDAGLGLSVFVDSANNAAQIYVLPFLEYVDSGIARLSGSQLPQEMLEQPFTSSTVQARDEVVQTDYMSALANYLAVTLFIALCGIPFHLAGYIAVEREAGLSNLIDVMSRSTTALSKIVVRLFSTYVAFVIIYLPGWLAIGAVVSRLIFSATSVAIVLPFHILVGLSLAAFSVFIGSFFKKAQLSGITALILSLVVAVAAQFVPRTPVAICVLGALFPSATYTFYAVQLAQWGEQLLGADLGSPPPDTANQVLPGYVFFAFLGAQILAYPILAVGVQLLVHGAPGARSRYSHIPPDSSTSVNLVNVSKTYKGGFGKDNVQAVNGVSLTIPRGQLVSLLGINGSGKSTLLSCLTGTQAFSSGTVELARDHTMGFCPQNNVAWDDLTVEENVRVFARLKAGGEDSKREVTDLLIRCDISNKAAKRPSSLSGGQKRKLQLALCFAGKTTLCCVDEASSGLDPLSRRKIWEIMLAERGFRTIIFTTHALDEADALSDHVAIMSLGRIIAQGCVAELKDKYGGGYRLRVLRSDGAALPLTIGGATRTSDRDGEVYTVSDSTQVCDVISQLEQLGEVDIAVRGPDMEDVFLSIASPSTEYVGASGWTQGARSNAYSKNGTSVNIADLSDVDTEPGKGSGFGRQVGLLFWKRVTIARRNYMPYVCAWAVPIITAAVAGYFFLRHFAGIDCSRGAVKTDPQTINLAVLASEYGIRIPVGPAGSLPLSSIPSQYRHDHYRLPTVNSFGGFEAYIHRHFQHVVPGGYYDEKNGTTLMAYRINGNLGFAALAKNLVDQYLAGTRISASFSTFPLPVNSATGESLQFILYMTLGLCAYPAFLALYPTYERLQNSRALGYSSGIKPAPLFLAYSLFDGVTALIVSVCVIVALTAATSVIYAPAYLFFAILLYGLSSTMLAYITSLFTKTLLSAFAFVAGFQAVTMLLYFVMYLLLLTFGTQTDLQDNLIAIQFTYGFLTPAGSLFRAMLLSLNQSQLLCYNQALLSYPGDIKAYGGPYLCFVFQILAGYAFLVFHDSGKLPTIRRFWKAKQTTSKDLEKSASGANDSVLLEEQRTEASYDALRVLHASRRFGHGANLSTAVDDVTFGVAKGEVLGLLGRNGAGKTTTMALIRGDLKPSEGISDIQIASHSIITEKLSARNHLGVCPQFNAADLMTVKQHLEFYARIRNIRNVEHSVTRAMAMIGLTPYQKRLTSKLSGGNQRKLNLCTAIIGNPQVIILDEPSSGMDAIAMRSMWRAIHDVSSERAVVITTHSMEEASHLSNKVAIMDARLLTVGSPSDLQARFGQNTYQLHVVHRDGSTANAQDMAEIQRLIASCPGVTLCSNDTTVLHGQLRLRIALQNRRSENPRLPTARSPGVGLSSLRRLLQTLEASKQYLGVRYYSINPVTLEDVFLQVVKP